MNWNWKILELKDFEQKKLELELELNKKELILIFLYHHKVMLCNNCCALLFTVVHKKTSAMSMFCQKELTTLPKVLELLKTTNCSLWNHNHAFVTDTQCVEIQLILCQNKVDLVITCYMRLLHASNSLELCHEIRQAMVLLVRATANSRYCWCELLQTADTVGMNYYKQQVLLV